MNEFISSFLRTGGGEHQSIQCLVRAAGQRREGEQSRGRGPEDNATPPVWQNRPGDKWGEPDLREVHRDTYWVQTRQVTLGFLQDSIALSLEGSWEGEPSLHWTPRPKVQTRAEEQKNSKIYCPPSYLSF